MKVGDLVMLSAYGGRVLRTGWVYPDDIGIVIGIKQLAYWTGYKVRWNRSSFLGARSHHRSGRTGDIRGTTWDHKRHQDRQDLKYVKLSTKK